MEKFDVRIGGFYVNEDKGLVREIIREESEHEVQWRSYELKTGRPTGDGLVCSYHRILTWANREATPDEVARMMRKEADIGEITSAREFAAGILSRMPDELLIAEIQRRGRRVV